jgi:hypothetical protein
MSLSTFCVIVAPIVGGAFMRRFSAVILGVILLAPDALAQPLPPGKPAGVTSALGIRASDWTLLTAAAIAAAGFSILFLDKSDSTPSTKP